MKLVEIQPNKYNNLAITEPGTSFYQTANWGDFYSRLGYTSIYLGYIDTDNVYSALGLFLIKNSKSFFERKTAICPFGYLINYYDTKLLSDFTKDVKKYLSRKGVGELTINPNVPFITSRGNNERLIKNICDLGYKKTKDNALYTTPINKISKAKATEDIVLKTYVIDNDENAKKLFKASTNYKHLYLSMNKYAKFVVCELDINKSINNLTKSINETKEYIEMHLEDYKYDAKIQNKHKQLDEKQGYLDLLNKSLSENDANPIIGVTCLIEYNNKLTKLFTDDKNEFRAFNTREVLNTKTLETISKLGYESFDSYTANENSQKTDLIGEFTYHIK